MTVAYANAVNESGNARYSGSGDNVFGISRAVVTGYRPRPQEYAAQSGMTTVCSSGDDEVAWYDAQRHDPSGCEKQMPGAL